MLANINAVVRLIKYKNMLLSLRSMMIKRVFSDNLADAVGVTASQVRKDFSFFGISGNKRGGYATDELITRINGLLGKDRVQKVIVVGLGNIGQALIRYKGFEKEGIKIVAGFDVDEEKRDASGPVPVLPVDKIGSFTRENGVKIAIIAVPESSAQAALDLIINTPVEGVLNFAPANLKARSKCIVHNINVGLELETVIYFVNAKNRGDLNASG